MFVSERIWFDPKRGKGGGSIFNVLEENQCIGTACDPITQKMEAGNHMFKVTLSHIVSLRPVWDTQTLFPTTTTEVCLKGNEDTKE